MQTTQQQQAQTLFFRSDLNQEEIADIVGINRKTLYTWIRKFGWTRTRTEDELTRDRVISQTLSLMERINLKTATKNNWNYNPEDIKALSKLAGIIKTLKSTKLANEDSKAIKGFMKFVAENNPDAQEVIKSSIDKYLQSKSGAATESYAEFSPNLVLEKDKYYDEVLEKQDNEPEEEKPETNPHGKDTTIPAPLPKGSIWDTNSYTTKEDYSRQKKSAIEMALQSLLDEDEQNPDTPKPQNMNTENNSEAA